MEEHKPEEEPQEQVEMKIVFLVPRFEPGKDGVGDVTRRLCSLLSENGIESILISWNDTQSGEREDGYCFTLKEAWENEGIPTLLRRLQPDWVSFQFIHYALDPNGLVFQWIPKMQFALSPYPLHLFLHEIWIGAHDEAPWKHKLLGWIQKRGILKMIRILKPERIQTSNRTYQDLLKKEGVISSVMKHCPGIVPFPTTKEENFERNRTRFVADELWAKRSESLWFLLFGAIHPEGSLDLFLPRLIEWGKRARMTPVLLSVGRQTPGEEAWLDYQNRFGREIQFVRGGEMENNFISYFMRKCDFGITTTPYQILGKSSVVVAMLEHGLPVFAYRNQSYGLPSDSFRDFHPGVIGPEEVSQNEVDSWSKAARPISYNPLLIRDEFLRELQSTPLGELDERKRVEEQL